MTDSTRSCPRCSATMEEFTRELILLDRCPSGCGIWLDDGELGQAIARRDEDRPDSEEHAAITAQADHDGAEHQSPACPVCSQTMKARTYAYDSGVLIDVCSTHGVWADDGELERMEAWMEGSEKLRDADRQQWSSTLTQLENEVEMRERRDRASMHMGPIAWLASRLPMGG